MSKTILIVDDSLTERVVLNGYLKDDYNLIEAASGEEAIEILHAQWQNISAIVLDIVMPGMDGFEVLRMVKASTSWLSIPVVITTGLDDEDSRERAIALGADNFVTKPFNRKLLLHVLNNAVQLREMAAMADQIMRDKLTGLLNRDSFFAEAERMIRRHEPGYYTLSCMDVENLKIINDQHGTEIGDEVLVHIAQTLNGFVGDIKGLCGRYMADKFAILFPTEMKDSQEIEENHIALTTPNCIKRPIRVCIGRYLIDDIALPVSSMFDRATMAREAVKGRYDTTIGEYNEKMRDYLLREQQIVGDMAKALENGEFEPWFQPQYNHATGELIGAEALVRWRKDGKIIPPNDFISIFEKNGFIYEIDKSVWRQVCAYLRQWMNEGMRPLPISVNISRYDLYQSDFMQTICGLVKEYDLPIELLRLEITESAFAENTDVITGMVGELILAGFTVEIDDFGSGYSSLNTLKDVPAAILKLDMRFFEATENSERGGNIVESIVRMAKWLGMAVIAEGVEDKAQADYLKTIGCYYIQGYYYAKPMPVDEYEAEMESNAGEAKLSRLETLNTLDSNLFWDPKSMETLIFNSYAGGACIFEAHDNTTELLRINDQYIGELHGLVPDGVRLNDSSIAVFVDKEERETLRNTLLAARKAERAASCVLRLTDGKQVEYVRFTARMIAQTNERRLYYAVIVNVTEQREAERKREEAARQLQVIMGNVNGSVSAFVMDEVGNTTPIFCNEKYYEIYGYTKEQAQAVQLDVMSCIVPEDFAEVIEKLNRLKKDGVPIDIDYRAIKQDGSIIFVRCIASRMSIEGYGDEVIVAVETDFTEQRTLQDQLRAIIENINGGVFVAGLRGDRPEILFINESYFEIIGYTREQFFAEIDDVFGIIHPDDRERIEKLYKDSEAEQKRYMMEYRIVRRNGAIRHVVCNTTVMRLFGVEEPVQLSVVNDVTMLREAQQKERTVVAQLKVIMENINGGVTASVFNGTDNVELLFANDGFYRLHGYTKEQLEAEWPNRFDIILPEDREKTVETIARITREGGSETCEYRCRKRDGSIMWAQASNTAVSLEGVKETVLLAIIIDITKEKAAMDKLRFLNETTRDIIAEPDVEKAINETLIKINGYFAADRSYVMELDKARQVFDNTYEACAPRVDLQKANQQELAFTPEDYWLEALKRKEYLTIESAEALSDGQAELRELLISRDIHSLIVVPLRQDGEFIGFVGADNPAKGIDHVSQLIGVANNLSMLLIRRDMAQKFAHDKDIMQVLIDDAPGGFLRLQVFDDKNPIIVGFNTGFCKMLDMTRDEVMDAYGDDVFQCFAEEEILALSEEIAEAVADCGQCNTRCRLKKKDGDYIWTQVFGRIVRGEGDELYLNSYFTDITEQKNAEQYQIELLDNMPCGAALFEYSGNDFMPIHINKRYWELVRRESADNSRVSSYGAIHPDDRVLVVQEIDSAIRNHRDAAVDCRLLYGDGGYRPFHITARSEKKTGGGYLIYVSYTPISDETMSIQEMLPIALSTMVSSSEDMSYVKDKDLHYICVSQSVANMAGLENPRDFIGRTAEEVFAETFADRFSEDDRRVIQTGEAVMNTLEHLPKADGGVCLARTSKFPILDSHGSAIGVYCISRDITAQREKENQLELLTSSIPGGLAAYSISNEGITTLYFNDGFFSYSGYTREEYGAMTAREPLALMFEEDRPKLLSMVHDFVEKKQDGMTGSCTYRCKTKSGGCRWMSMKGVLSQVGGDTYVLHVVQFDVTEMRKADEQLRHLTDNIPGGIATFCYMPGNIETVYFNDGICALTGYSRKEFETHSISMLDLVFDEDRSVFREQIERLIAGETTLDFIVRIHAKDKIKWINTVARTTGHVGDAYTVNAVLTDVTMWQEEKERLRLANEEYRIATIHSNRIICRYNVETQTITMSPDAAKRLGLPETMSGVPYERVKMAKISEETKDAYIAFFEGIMAGKKESTAIYRKLLPAGWRWIEANATAVFDADGKPFSAIISYTDITEQREKEAIYIRWQNSIAERPEDSYTLLRCNLSKNKTFDSMEGRLLTIDFDSYAHSLDERAEAYISQCVYADDRDRFRAFMRVDTMLAEYYRGHRADSIEFREFEPDGKTRWIRLSIDLVEYPDSSDVQAYLMFENIDESKREQQRIIERAQTDSLTGVLNRATFAVRANQIMSESKPGVKHALLMIDIDDFKSVNDVFGHGAGDQALIGIANILIRSSRKEDLVGRLGGDEFIVFLPDIQNETAAAIKARQLCKLIRKNFGVEVQISASIGIAMFPQDGEGFDALYKAADDVLYRVKDSGKNGYAFVNDDLVLDAELPRQVETPMIAPQTRDSLRRILIVDDSKVDLDMLSMIFKNDFRVEKATDGATALAKLQYYKTSISAVLLDLYMPKMNGFEVLERMRQDEETRMIPVIVVSADEQQETQLKVISAGAEDLVAKPVDPDGLRIRVNAAIARVENERMRTQNSFQSLQNAEIDSYRIALERFGIMVITIEWGKNEFSYSPSVSATLAGEYEGKRFWRVLLSSMVTDPQTVQKMQQLVHSIAEDRKRTECEMVVKLKKASGVFSLFDMNIFKKVNEFGLAERIIIALKERASTQQENERAEDMNNA